MAAVKSRLVGGDDGRGSDPTAGRSGLASRRVAALGLVVLLASGLAVATIWIRLLSAAVDSGWVTEHTGTVLGRDLGAFTGAASLLADGRAVEMYDPAPFEARGFAGFVNPPFFAVAFLAIRSVGFPALWVAWTAASIAAVVGACALLGARRPWLVATAVLFTIPMLVDVRLGQTAAFAALAVAVIYRLLAADRPRLAGIVAASLAYKPQYLVGFAVWWLVDRRRRPALAACTVVVAAVIAASAITMTGAWEAFFDRLASLTGQYAEAPVIQFTAWHTVSALLPWLGDAAVTIVWLVAALLVLILQAAFVRRAGGSLEAMVAAAVVVPLLVAPHVLVYDWVLLVVPLVLLGRAFPGRRETWLAMAAVLAAAAFVAAPIAALADGTVGVAIPIAYPVLAACSFGGARVVIGEVERSAVPADRP